MATTAKKKPSAAQIAARKLFAQRAKAGTLGGSKKKKSKPAAKTLKSGAQLVTRKKAAPVKRAVSRGYSIEVQNYDGSWRKLFSALELQTAKNVAQIYADDTGEKLRIVSK